MWKDENKPVTAGSGHNLDASWESQSLPIGNGSLGANIMGSVEAERITFNEKTLWRGGPNTAKGADYYWNVNKQSAHLLDEIRKAFTEGDPDGNGVNGDTYALSAAGFMGEESPYTNYLPEFYQESYPSFTKDENGVWYDGFMEQEFKDSLLRLRDAYVTDMLIRKR